MSRRYTVVATGTGCGKTFFARGLARALSRVEPVAALKPIETGVDHEPLDACALARAARRPELAYADGLYRTALPAAPLAAQLEGAPRLDYAALLQRTRELRDAAPSSVIESAGGLLVPLDPTHTNADLARDLDDPVLLLARDALGTLSHTLTCLESARARSLPVAALVLTRGPWSDGDPSVRTNARVLAELTTLPVLVFPACPDDDEALADAIPPTLV